MTIQYSPSLANFNDPEIRLLQDKGACQPGDVQLFDGAHHDKNYAKDAKSICFQCPVQWECEMYANKHHLQGVWGGYTETERENRRRYRRNRQRMGI
jgi:hypothetical protein